MVGPRKPVNDMQERRSSVLQPVQSAAAPSLSSRRVAWYE
jgi:hypothetical protein